MATVSTAYPAQLGARSAQRTPVSYISGTGADNDAGTIVTGGTIASDRHQGISTKTLANEVRTIGSRPVANTELGSIKANNSRTFAYQAAATYVIVGATSSLGGVSTTVLTNSSNKVRRKFHWNVVDKATLYSGTAWDYKSGQLEAIPSASSVAYKDSSGNTSTNVDKVTLETNDEPGRLTFSNGKAAPTTQGYAARHLG